jgi:energy-coupling factor transporter ATP-binding protein EcfA2
VSEPQTFEMPRSDGRTTWTVAFDPKSGVRSLGDTLLVFTIEVRLTTGRRQHWALFGAANKRDLQWTVAGVLPADSIERHRCYQQAAIRYCRRHLDELLAQEQFEHLLEEDDLTFVLSMSSGETLQAIEHEIDDILDMLPTAIAELEAHHKQATPHAFSLVALLRFPAEWKKHEPNLRRMRDSDERIVKAYEATAEFYEVYQRHLEQNLFQSHHAKWIAADLGQANTLGHHALRALYAARQPARTPVAQGRSAGVNGGWSADRAVHLRRIAISNVRCFSHAELPLTPPADTEKGQWIVLLGENGMGKTSILRALALALLPEDAARNHVYELSGRAGLVRNAPDGRDVHGRVARIDVEIGQGAATSVNIFQQRPRETISVASPLLQRPLVLGYGCRRGSALGDIRRESNTDYLLGTATVFDEDARVIHADTWLRDLRDQDGVLFDSVCRILRELLLDVGSISVEPGGTTWVEGPVIGRVPLAGLSDGYLTTLGWLVDVLARWIAYARSHAIPVGPDFHKRMPCVVLIDEIDLHLHPRWQTEVITKLRDMFPMTTFVATTHNPLTLHGTQPGEVHVIRAGDDGKLEIVQKDLPLGIRTDELLTGEWFGLSSTLDADTQQLLKDHFALLQQGRPEGDPERVAIEEKLRARLGHFAATLPEKLAHELVAEQLDPAARPVTDEDRARLRAMYEQRLRDAAQAIAQDQQSDEP